VAKQEQGRLYSINEASEEIGMRPNQIMYAIKIQVIKPRKVGWIWALTEDEVQTLKEYKAEKDRRSRILNKKKKK